MKIFILLLLSLNAWSANTTCTDELAGLPILARGRLKPLAVHAHETMKYLTGKSSVKQNGKKVSALNAFCLLSWESVGGETFSLSTRIEHMKSQELLGETSMSLDQLYEVRTEVRRGLMGEKLNTPFKKDLTKLLNKAQLYQQVKQGQNWMLYRDGSWVPFANFMNNPPEDF